MEMKWLQENKGQIFAVVVAIAFVLWYTHKQ
jgi:hypothetical protein